MTHILITDLREIRYMAYVPERVKRLDYAFQFKYDNAIAEYNAALEKAKRESLPFDQPFDVTYIIDKLHYQACEKADTYIESKTPEPGIYQVPVEKPEIVEQFRRLEDGIEWRDIEQPLVRPDFNEYRKVARIVQPKEESQEDYRCHIEDAIYSTGRFSPEASTELAIEIINSLDRHDYNVTRKRG